MAKRLSFAALSNPSLVPFRDVAQSGSVPAWGAGGRWFESSRPDFEKSSVKTEFFYGPLRLYITKFKG